MVSLGSRLLMFGGLSAPGVYCQESWIWDGDTWTPLVTKHLPPKCAFHTLAEWRGGKAILFGGQTEGERPLGQTWLFDGSDWNDLTGTYAPPPRWSAAAARPEGLDAMMLIGGMAGHGGDPQDYTFDMYCYESQWSSDLALPEYREMLGRSQHTLTTVGPRMLMFGGIQYRHGITKELWELGPDQTQSLAFDRGPCRRLGHAAVSLAGNLVIIGGGGSAIDGFFGDTWAWDGGRWNLWDPGYRPVLTFFNPDSRAGTARMNMAALLEGAWTMEMLVAIPRSGQGAGLHVGAGGVGLLTVEESGEGVRVAWQNPGPDNCLLRGRYREMPRRPGNNQWYHLAVCCAGTGADVVVYFDGEPVQWGLGYETHPAVTNDLLLQGWSRAQVSELRLSRGRLYSQSFDPFPFGTRFEIIRDDATIDLWHLDCPAGTNVFRSATCLAGHNIQGNIGATAAAPIGPWG